ncbi:Por secretion system C-terminal sorting domain-containing protein [Flexibacter flexilis DSM 6793]|uniref:Por secretion system C-terminal sorting domain-containing protein n=1 Tax=Flexibacter flexilis DSM 6793 TaxID=927664 RepID=A0A1I1HYA0_9BACT|nr:choice-of-anchor L domain-containing protein [Flexibacter flexilis]SFC28924.1 Por secretion system C-terminal sorting domain-containing protein [Flexibacter flexilis DSM 6793]
MKKTLFALGTILLCGASVSAQSVSVKPVNSTTYPLIDSIINKLAGSGVVISNVKTNLGSGSTSVTSNALGSFKANDGIVGKSGASIKNGVLLTTGLVSGASGTSTVNSSTSNGLSSNGNNNGLNGNTLLTGILPTSTTLNDVCVVQFDFIPVSDSISFNYVFASEEYNAFVGTDFNDVFGLFIKGPGIVTQAGLPANTRNIAVLPSTSTNSNIVSINNVNAGNGMNASASNSSYYINNDNTEGTYISSPVDNSRSNNLRYDGLTKKLTAKAAVFPCQTYTLTFAIADVQDGIFDSGVFIENGSLSSFGNIIVPMMPTISKQTINCNQTVLSVAAADTAYSNFVWSNGQTGTSITVSGAGTYSVVRNYQRCPNIPAIVLPPASVQVGIPSTPPAPAISQDALPCYVGLFVIPDSTQADYMWYYNGNIVPNVHTNWLDSAEAGTYTVQYISTSGCTSEVSAPLAVQVGNPNATLTVTGTTLSVPAAANTTYQWYKDGELIQGATQASYTALTTGVYSVQITSLGCMISTQGTLIEMVGGIKGKDIGHLVKVYPSPATDGKVNVEVDNLHDAQLTITNELGQSIKQMIINQQHTTFALKQGVYFLKIQSREGVSIQKLVVE